MVVVIVSFLTQREDGIGGYIDPRILTLFLSSDIFFHRYTSSDQTFVLPIGYRHMIGKIIFLLPRRANQKYTSLQDGRQQHDNHRRCGQSYQHSDWR